MSTVPSDNEISDSVTRFRAAIDAAGDQIWADQGLSFPRGSCGHVAELLGRHLIETFGITPDYVYQWAHDDVGGWTGSHAWLEWNGLTLDITGDQFGWAPVIVTRTPTFHGQADDGDRHPVCLPHQAGWWAQNCAALWRAISIHL